MSKKGKKQQLLVLDPTIGADIEVFLQDKDTGEIVSAEGHVRGTKEEPFQFRQDNPFFATSLDNVMAEFCIPPATNPEDFWDYIRCSLLYINTHLNFKLKAAPLPSAYVDPKYLQTDNAKEFGCLPDYNAWAGGTQNPKPEAENLNLRSCGGHIHIGYRSPNHETTMALMRAMDIFVGLPSILQEPDNERKRLYGKAGAFRFKPYGGEYRTVSNYYISTPELAKWAFNNTLAAIDFTNQQNSLSTKEVEGIQAAINLNNAELATTLCNYFGVKLAA